MVSALAAATLTTVLTKARWWLAAIIGTVVGEVAWLYWVPLEAWSTWLPGFLPFAAVPALAGAAIGRLIKKRATK
jgi:hypothetical protein